MRNEEGHVLELGTGKLQHLSSPLHAEVLAALKGLDRAAYLGMNKVIVETDSIILGEALKTTSWDMSPYGALFRQIRDLMIYELLDFFCIGL